ncbi:MAG: hypothetical protein ACI31V_03710 [Bacilli bacterium]
MENIEIKIEKYRTNINEKSITDAFKVYYETQDRKIRENLIYKYIPKIKKKISDIKTNEDKEDIEQMVYEVLINCIDKYNPNKTEKFSGFLKRKIQIELEKDSTKLERLSISDIETELFNEKRENYITNNTDKKQLINKIKTILKKYPYKEYLKIFKQIYGIDSEKIEKAQLAESLNVTEQYIEVIEKYTLLYIFLNLPKELQKNPSEKIKKMLTNPELRDMEIFFNNLILELKQTNINYIENRNIIAERYRNCISDEDIKEAHIIYYETKDKKIRKNLICKYIPKIKKMLSGLDNIIIEKEDLEQIMYEALINCIDKYNPYNKEEFSNYLYSRIYFIIKKYSIKQDVNDMKKVTAVFLNDETEDYIINKIYNKQLINIIKELIENYPYEKYSEIFKKIYGINCERIEKAELARKFDVKYSYIDIVEKKILLYIYLNLPEDFKYYPSEKIKKMLTNEDFSLTCNLAKPKKEKMRQMNINKMEYITFNSSYIKREDEIVVQKTKKFEHK